MGSLSRDELIISLTPGVSVSCGGTFEDSSDPVSASIIAWTVSTVAWTVVSFGLLSAMTILSDAVDGFYIFTKMLRYNNRNCYVIFVIT